MRKAKNIFANIDYISILLYYLLIIFGALNIFASQYNEDSNTFFDFSKRYGKQIIFMIIASFLALIILIIDWKFYYSLSYIFYIIQMSVPTCQIVLNAYVNQLKEFYKL